MKRTAIYTCTCIVWQYPPPPSLTVLVANIHELLHLIGILHYEAREVLHIDTDVRPHVHVQFLLHCLVEEVTNLLIVQLEIGHTYQEPAYDDMGYGSMRE